MLQEKKKTYSGKENSGSWRQSHFFQLWHTGQPLQLQMKRRSSGPLWWVGGWIRANLSTDPLLTQGFSNMGRFLVILWQRTSFEKGSWMVLQKKWYSVNTSSVGFCLNKEQRCWLQEIPGFFVSLPDFCFCCCCEHKGRARMGKRSKNTQETQSYHYSQSHQRGHLQHLWFQI